MNFESKEKEFSVIRKKIGDLACDINTLARLISKLSLSEQQTAKKSIREFVDICIEILQQPLDKRR